MKNIVTSVLSILLSVTAFSQTVDSTHNALRDGDCLVQYELHHNLNSTSGDGILWDLSQQKTFQSRSLKITRRTDNSNGVAVSDRLSSSYYRLCDDSLLYDGFESNLAKVDYHGGIPVMVFPMHYGDSLTHVYDGSGSYSDDWMIETVGNSKSEIDAKGTLITPESDTIHNVLRLHVSRHSHEKILSKSKTERDVQSSQVREDDYLWYAPGYRYPVLHANTYTVEGDSVASLWYIPLFEQEILPEDNDNLTIRQTDILNKPHEETEEGGAESLLHYTLRNNRGDKRVTILYDQFVGGSVTFILSDVRGTVYSSNCQNHDAGTGYSAEVSLAGLRNGNYVIYICMDGQRFAEKILVE